MDFYSFINSKSISEYLREIKYEFNSLEAAWLIYQCKSISLKEKHDAWRQFIQEMPDCKVEKRPNCEPRDSLHGLIQEYILIIESQYELFGKQEANAVYQYRYYCSGDPKWEGDKDVYATIDECWKDIDDYREYDIEAVEISKRYIGSNRTIDVRYKPDGTVMEVDSNVLTDHEFDVIVMSFDGFWFDFPVPFKKGDILIDTTVIGPKTRYSESGPIVMRGVTPWEIEHNKDRKEKGYGDNSDMIIWGYFQNEDGRVYHEVTNNYMDFDYYGGPFDGVHRLLLALSNYLKDEIGLDMLLTAYRKVIMDYVSHDVMLHSWYTEEGLKLAGLFDVVEVNNRRHVHSGLNPRIRFEDNICAKPNYDWSKNQDIYNKCIEIASNYDQPKEMLYVYGNSGCGKTTLLQCMGNKALRLSTPDLLYTTAENFVNDMVEAIKNSDMATFREKYRKLDFLIFEDLQKICGKEASIEEFTNMLNDLISSRAQVVISADRPLGKLDIPETLRSKLSFATQMEMK